MYQRQEERFERDGLGRLPQYAPLANPYVPFQQRNPSTYPARKGIVRGTLFPGLELPFHGMVNKGELGDRPLQELQAFSFALVELGLYLDTHPDDESALALFRSYAEKYEACKTRYEAKYGPLVQRNAGTDGRYQWICAPWPWEFRANQEG